MIRRERSMRPTELGIWSVQLSVRPGRRSELRRLACATVALGSILVATLLATAPGPASADHGPDHSAGSSPAAGTPFSPLEALQQLGADTLGGATENEFLHPDVAFVLSTDVENGTTVVARWAIADAYYLYRERFKFALKDSPGASLGPAELPDGKIKEDPYFGPMEVYYDSAEARLPLSLPDGGAREVQLEITYQGCADAGLCYPPTTKTVSLSPASPLEVQPAAGSTPTTTGDMPVGELPEQDRLARALATGSTWLVLTAFFGLGLLLTFTPCVLPMIPILSSIIVGQGPSLTSRRAFTLSLTYVLAMSATYTAAGVIAGLSGANLQAAFQNPWVLGTFSGVFVLLALSMFGLYQLQLPLGLQQRLVAMSSRQQGGTYLGVGAMGLLSALIVGPCVAAPLAGALIYIARTGDAVLGGAALFALSLGMGAPVLVIGTSAGKLIPRVGPWMTTIKGVFGVVLLGVAIYLLERLLPGWAALALWGMLFAGVAFWLLRGRAGDEGEPKRPWPWLARVAGVASLGYAVVLAVGAASGGDDMLRPLSRLAIAGSPTEAAVEFKPVKGIAGLEAELRAAASAGRPVMLDFYADWCVSCKELERETFSDPSVKAVLASAVLLRTDVTANDAEDQALLEAFGLFGPPAILFFGADGAERARFRVVGFMKAAPFRDLARRGLYEATAMPGAASVSTSSGPRAVNAVKAIN